MIITIEATVNSTIEKVWRAWTTPSDINNWNFAGDDWHNPKSSINLKIGGSFSYRMESRDGKMGFDFSGIFTEVRPYQLLEYIMEDGRRVSVNFKTAGSQVCVSESFEAESENSAEMQKNGWQLILNRFAGYVEKHAQI
jgi:uncharacterized protein YndB with AHSA1/START domain